MFSVLFTPAARSEVMDAQDWYESVRPGLGRLFAQELEAAVNQLEINPHMFPEVFRDLRRCLLKKFPYALFFRAEEHAVAVIACFHCSRNPRLWKRRS